MQKYALSGQETVLGERLVLTIYYKEPENEVWTAKVFVERRIDAMKSFVAHNILIVQLYFAEVK